MPLPKLAFRSRLILTCASLAQLTAALMIVPLFLTSSRQAESLYRERLTAVAHGVSASISADTVEKLAATHAMIPYVVTREVLRGFAWRRGDSLHATVREGLFIAVRAGSGYRVIAHGDWPIVPPHDSLEWKPPASFNDSLGNVHGGASVPLWVTDANQLMAVAPIFAGT